MVGTRGLAIHDSGHSKRIGHWMMRLREVKTHQWNSRVFWEILGSSAFCSQKIKIEWVLILSLIQFRVIKHYCSTKSGWNLIKRVDPCCFWLILSTEVYTCTPRGGGPIRMLRSPYHFCCYIGGCARNGACPYWGGWILWNMRVECEVQFSSRIEEWLTMAYGRSGRVKAARVVTVRACRGISLSACKPTWPKDSISCRHIA